MYLVRVTSAFLPGLVTGLALIVAIGAQNAFVLRQGIRREHVGVVVAICIVSDIFLIGLGTAGIGVLVESLTIKAAEGPIVLGEVGRYPVYDDADAVFVQCID